MIYGSVCSGIEAASVAWRPLGWRAAWFAEIDPFPSSVLAHRFPTVPNRGDFTRIEDGAIDLLVGGTPCQAFSVAGKRGGLDDPRGNLTIEFARLAQRLRPRWIVWENVPGVLSIDGGRTFGAYLGALADLGYGFAYRVLDARFFGLAQRRQRVLLVGSLGGWRPAAAVLFERGCLSRNPPPREESREGIAGDAPCGARGDRREGLIQETTHTLSTAHSATEDGNGRWVPLVPAVARTITTGEGFRQDFETCTLLPSAFPWQGGGSYNIRATAESPTLSRCQTPAVVGAFNPQSSPRTGGIGYAVEQSPTLGTGPTPALHRGGLAVRRLTPRECERLQGFPDDWTLVPRGNGKMAADAPRYRAIGNAMPVPVMRWIGERIELVDRVTNGER